MSFKDTLLGLFIVLIWGMNFVVIVWGLDDFPPLLLGASRFILIALLGSFFVRMPQIPWRWMALYALSIGFAQFAFLFWAMNVGMPAGMASLVLQSQVLFTTVFAIMWLKESINGSQLIGLLISAIGLFIIGASIDSSSMTAIGFGLSIVTASCWAVGNTVTRTLANRGYKTDIGLVVWSSWFAVPPFIAVSLIFEGPNKIVAAISSFGWTTFGAILYLSLGASIVGYGLWSRLLSRYPAAKVTPLTLCVPIVGFASAAFFLGESISLQQGVGIVVVLLGLAMNTFGSRIKLHLDRLRSS